MHFRCLTWLIFRFLLLAFLFSPDCYTDYFFCPYFLFSRCSYIPILYPLFYFLIVLLLSSLLLDHTFCCFISLFLFSLYIVSVSCLCPYKFKVMLVSALLFSLLFPFLLLPLYSAFSFLYLYSPLHYLSFCSLSLFILLPSAHCRPTTIISFVVSLLYLCVADSLSNPLGFEFFLSLWCALLPALCCCFILRTLAQSLLFTDLLLSFFSLLPCLSLSLMYLFFLYDFVLSDRLDYLLPFACHT